MRTSTSHQPVDGISAGCPAVRPRPESSEGGDAVSFPAPCKPLTALALPARVAGGGFCSPSMALSPPTRHSPPRAAPSASVFGHDEVDHAAVLVHVEMDLCAGFIGDAYPVGAP